MRHDPEETLYLQTVLRMAERLILPAAGLPGHYPYKNRLQQPPAHGEQPHHVNQKMDEALQKGRVTPDQLMDLEMACLRTSGQTDGHRREHIVETAVRAQPEDIDNAKRRAQIMADATGFEVKPMVITATLGHHTEERADQEGVTLIIFNPGKEF